MAQKRVYKCPLCDFEGYKSKLYSHVRDCHWDYIESKCSEHGEDVTNDDTVNKLVWRLVEGNLDFELCPKCGHAILSRTEPHHRRMCGYCGYVPHTDAWKKSMAEWRKTEDGQAHIEKFRERAKESGKIYGVQNFKRYTDTHKEEIAERGRIYGKVNGPKNLYKYNHDEKYAELRKERAKKAVAKRESNIEYLLARAKRGEFNTSQRGSGEADLYVFKCIDPKKGYEICKVGYSRDFQKFRKWAYRDFNPTKVMICRLSGQQVLDFEQECLDKFNHYWMNRPGITGKTEWYWGKEYDKIIELANSKGYEFSEQDIVYD